MRTGTMIHIKVGRRSGFTMVELLIAIIIIGILTAIIVPVLSNRASDARIAAAKADMEAIANAESQIALDTGYLVRLHVIDDSGAVGDGLGSDDLGDAIDTIRDEEFNDTNNPDSQRIFLDAKTGVRMPINLYDRVVANPEQFGWRGPYATFHNKIKFDPLNPLVTPWVYGAPLDPWGNPYFLFVAGAELTAGTAAVGGWIEDTGSSTNPSPTFSYAPALVGGPVDATNFDRPTLLSLGPNGLVGDGSGAGPGYVLGGGDDLVRAF